MARFVKSRHFPFFVFDFPAQTLYDRFTVNLLSSAFLFFLATHEFVNLPIFFSIVYDFPAQAQYDRSTVSRLAAPNLELSAFYSLTGSAPMSSLETLALTKEVVIQIVQAVENPRSQRDEEEANLALWQLLVVSIQPPVFLVQEFLGKELLPYLHAALASRLLEVLSNIAKTRCQPPYSMKYLYNQTVIDWLRICVAEDSH